MGHTIIRPCSTGDTHPDEPDIAYDNDLCHAIRAGSQVCLGGQVGTAFAGEFVGLGNPARQVEQAMENARVPLKEAGSPGRNGWSRSTRTP